MAVKYDIPFKNLSQESVPAFALLEVSRSSGVVEDGKRKVIGVEKPRGGQGIGSKVYLINGPSRVAAGLQGMATRSWPARILYTGDPVVGRTFRSTAGNWYLQPGDGPFRIVGGEDGTSVRVEISPKGGTGDELLAFELIEDMSLLDTFSTARLVLPDGTLDTEEGTEFFVTDPLQIWQGRSLASSSSEVRGYRGTAVKSTDDFDDGTGATGKPGYQILDMEGPSQFLFVILKENQKSSGTLCALENVDLVSGIGYPHKGRVETGQSSGEGTGTLGVDELIVSDAFGFGEGAVQGDTWLALGSFNMDVEEWQYDFFVTHNRGGILAKVHAEISAASYHESGTDIDLGSGSVRIYAPENVFTQIHWIQTDRILTVRNMVRDRIGIGQMVQVKFIQGVPFVDAEDCN